MSGGRAFGQPIRITRMTSTTITERLSSNRNRSTSASNVAEFHAASGRKGIVITANCETAL